MVVSAAQRAKRALVVLLRSIAAIYNVAVALTRDSTDAAVLERVRATSRERAERASDGGSRAERVGDLTTRSERSELVTVAAEYDELVT
jgi:hypothetical protein